MLIKTEPKKTTIESCLRRGIQISMVVLFYAYKNWRMSTASSSVKPPSTSDRLCHALWNISGSGCPRAQPGTSASSPAPGISLLLKLLKTHRRICHTGAEQVVQCPGITRQYRGGSHGPSSGVSSPQNDSASTGADEMISNRCSLPYKRKCGSHYG